MTGEDCPLLRKYGWLRTRQDEKLLTSMCDTIGSWWSSRTSAAGAGVLAAGEAAEEEAADASAAAAGEAAHGAGAAAAS